MESTATNQTPSPSSTVEDPNGDGVYTEEFTKLPPNSPHSSEEDDSVDFSLEKDSSLVPIGFELHEAINTETGSRSVDKNQTHESEHVVGAKDSKTGRDLLDDDLEIVIKNQHEYYFYCPCCGEDITKTVKLVKKSDLQPVKNGDTANEPADTKNGSKSEDKKTKVLSWFPDYIKQLFLSVYEHIKDQGKTEVDSESTINDIGTNSEEPSIDVKTEKDRPSFPKWYIDVFAWLFLCVIIALSVLSSSTSPQQSLPSIPLQLELPAISALPMPSASILLLLPASAVLFLVIMAMRSRYSFIYPKEKGDKEVDSNTTDHHTTSEEQVKKTQYDNDQAADPAQDSDKKTDNQKVHPVPVDPPTPQEQQSMQIAKKENHENVEKKTPAQTQPEPGLKPDTQPKIPTKSVEPGKGGNKLEILKSIVYGGLTQSITSLCTVTSAAASGASTLNVLALGVANLSSGLLLIVHSLQELINEKPKTRTNTNDQKEEEEEEDRYVEALGRREKWWFHRLIVITSFVICGLIPPLVYGFSFRRRVEKKQEYKTLAVYAVSLLCIVLLSVAKAYVSKRREYVKTLFKYTSMATTASGFSTFMGYFVNQWLEKSGFYDEATETPRV